MDDEPQEQRSVWPADWARRKAGEDCPLCRAIRTGPPDDMFEVIRLPYTTVWLQKYSSRPGYCVVVWRGEHVAEAFELDRERRAGYCLDVVAVAGAVQAVFDPVKMNTLTLGNNDPHLHSHVVPRYPADPSPGRPLAWDDMFQSEQIPDDTLARHRELLRAELQHTAGEAVR